MRFAALLTGTRRSLRRLAYVRPVTLEEMATVDVQVVTVKNPRFGHQFNVGALARGTARALLCLTDGPINCGRHYRTFPVQLEAELRY